MSDIQIRKTNDSLSRFRRQANPAHMSMTTRGDKHGEHARVLRDLRLDISKNYKQELVGIHKALFPSIPVSKMNKPELVENITKILGKNSERVPW
jgi:hypothetical protein